MTWQTLRHPITYPSGVDVASNGRLRDDQLRQSMAPGHGMVQLHPLASRAFDVLQFNCWHETGQQLTVVSKADAYRSYERQRATFLARYTQTYNPLTTTTNVKVWEGTRWYQRRGVAMAASPGTSNHGWGLAFDAAWWVENPLTHSWSIKAVTSNRLAFAWLELNAIDHGFAWNNRTEAWHMEYFAGDAVPQRVLNLERLFGVAA